MLRARATLDLADVLTEELSRDGGESQRLLAEVEQPLEIVLGEMEHVGIAADTDYLSELESHFAAEVKAAAAERARGGRPRVQPRLAQAAAGDPLHRAQPAQDQEDQVRLHHRRRRPAEPVHPDRRPAPGAPAAPPRRGQAEIHGRRPAQVGLRRRPHPHHVQPDRRRHRPALLHRPQPAEHPDPHRGGPPHPPRLRGRRGLRALLTADYSQIEMRIMAHLSRRRGPDRGVQLRRRLPRRHRLLGLPRPGRGSRPRPAPQDQSDELRPGVRPERLRPLQPAHHRHRRGPQP